MHSMLTDELFAAAQSNNVEWFRDVIKRCQTSRRITQADLGHALCLSAEIGASDIVKELLRCKADVLHVEPGGRRPIHFACLGGSIDCLRRIVRGGSPISLQDESGLSVLHLAVQECNRNIVAFLVKKNASLANIKSYANKETALHVACKLGDDVIVQTILARCVNPNVQTTDKKTALMYAIEHHHSRTVRILSEFRVNMNIHDVKGNTALHIAVQKHPEVTDVLLEYGANPETVNKNGETALHIVSQQKDNFRSFCDKAELLLDYGASVHHCDSMGQTSLHFAAAVGNVLIVQLLVTRGANINSVACGQTPLNGAVFWSRNEVIEYLLLNGADPTICEESSGLTPLHKLLSSRNTSKLKYTELLLKHGAKVNKISIQGYTLLDRCVFHSVLGGFDPNCLLRIVQAGAHMKPEGPRSAMQHNSALCWLTWHNHLPIAYFLVDCDWELKQENWLRLTGRTEQMTQFLNYALQKLGKPRPLRNICRTVLRQHFLLVSKDTDIVPYINKSPLPPLLKRFVNLEMEIEACKDLVAHNS